MGLILPESAYIISMNIKDRSINVVLAITPKEIADCKTEKEYVEWTSNILNELEPKLAENSVIAITGYFGNDSIENKVNAYWSSVLESVETTDFAVGELIVWKRGIEVKSEREDRINTICTPIFILCRKEEYRTYHLNVHEKTKKGNAVYHTPISNLIETSGSTIEEDYKQIEEELLKLYNPPKGKVYRLFEENN